MKKISTRKSTGGNTKLTNTCHTCVFKNWFYTHKWCWNHFHKYLNTHGWNSILFSRQNNFKNTLLPKFTRSCSNVLLGQLKDECLFEITSHIGWVIWEQCLFWRYVRVWRERGALQMDWYGDFLINSYLMFTEHGTMMKLPQNFSFCGN